MERIETSRPGEAGRMPLEQRLRGVTGKRRGGPRAINLRDIDFFRDTGEMTDSLEEYQDAYKSGIAPYGSTDTARKNVYDLVAAAETLNEPEQAFLLLWSLVRPFADLKKKETEAL